MDYVLTGEDLKKEIQSLFKEEITIEQIGYSGSEEQFRLISVDGKKLPEEPSIYMQYYRDDIYLHPKRPNYRGSLFLSDYGKNKYERYPEFCYKKYVKESETEKFSIHQAIQNMYANKIEM